jgi:hypothetical protein
LDEIGQTTIPLLAFLRRNYLDIVQWSGVRVTGPQNRPACHGIQL